MSRRYLNCRSGKDSTDYDLVVGGVANDKKHCLYCILKGVKHYDSESDFASEKI